MLAMPGKVLKGWAWAVKTDHLRKVCVAYRGRPSDARDSSPCLVRFGGNEPGYGSGTPCGPPTNTQARSTGGHDRMEDKKQMVSHKGCKSLKSQYVFVVEMNSSPGRYKSCAGHQGYQQSIYADVNADVNLSSKKVGECCRKPLRPFSIYGHAHPTVIRGGARTYSWD